MQSPNTDSTAESTRCASLRALLTLALLAVGSTTVAAQPPGDDDGVAAAAENAVKVDDTPQAEQVSRRDQRRMRKAADADEAQASNQPAAIVPPGDPESQIVCRSYRRLGTRIDRRVCATAAQWAEREAASERDAQRVMRELGEASAIVPPGADSPGRTPL